MSQDATVTWLTQEVYDRLNLELQTLSTTGRQEITDRIQSAREEGDLKENSGYHAAKEEQGKQEARIRQLTELLRTAEVGEAPESHGVVETGTVITATIAGDETTFLIGSREIAEDSDLDVVQRAEPARRRHHRPQGRRLHQLHRSERPRDRRDDHQRRDLDRPVAHPVAERERALTQPSNCPFRCASLATGGSERSALG